MIVAPRSTQKPNASAGKSASTGGAAPFEVEQFRRGLGVELEHGLHITEEVLRHLVTRDERPPKSSRREDGDEGLEDMDDDADLPSGLDDEDEDDGTERIDESESEAAPAAID